MSNLKVNVFEKELNEAFGTKVTKTDSMAKTTVKSIDRDGIQVLNRLLWQAENVELKRSGTGITIIVTA